MSTQHDLFSLYPEPNAPTETLHTTYYAYQQTGRTLTIKNKGTRRQLVHVMADFCQQSIKKNVIDRLIIAQTASTRCRDWRDFMTHIEMQYQLTELRQP